MKIKTYEDWQIDKDGKDYYCSRCGNLCDYVSSVWRMDMATNKEYKAPCSPCCQDPLTDHRTSVELRLTKVGKRYIKERYNDRLINTLLGIGRRGHGKTG